MRVRCDGSEIGKMERRSFHREARLAGGPSRNRGATQGKIDAAEAPARCRCSGRRPCGIGTTPQTALMENYRDVAGWLVEPDLEDRQSV